jgi:hypothetical protein
VVQRIQYPLATQLAVDYLGAKLPGLKAGSRIPATGDRFVVLRRGGGSGDGGGAELITDRPILMVEVYDRYEDDAERLAMDVRSWLHALAGETFGETQCYGVEEYSGPANMPDPRRPELSRYTFTLALRLRGKTYQ